MKFIPARSQVRDRRAFTLLTDLKEGKLTCFCAVRKDQGNAFYTIYKTSEGFYKLLYANSKSDQKHPINVFLLLF